MARRCQVTTPAACVGHVAPCWAATSVHINPSVYTHNALMHHVAPRCAIHRSVTRSLTQV